MRKIFPKAASLALAGALALAAPAKAQEKVGPQYMSPGYFSEQMRMAPDAAETRRYAQQLIEDKDLEKHDGHYCVTNSPHTIVMGGAVPFGYSAHYGYAQYALSPQSLHIFASSSLAAAHFAPVFYPRVFFHPFHPFGFGSFGLGYSWPQYYFSAFYIPQPEARRAPTSEDFDDVLEDTLEDMGHDVEDNDLRRPNLRIRSRDATLYFDATIERDGVPLAHFHVGPAGEIREMFNAIRDTEVEPYVHLFTQEEYPDLGAFRDDVIRAASRYLPAKRVIE